MKAVVILLTVLSLALGGIPIGRFDPCIFIDCTKFTSTPKTSTTLTSAQIDFELKPKPDRIKEIEKRLVGHT